MSYYKKQGSTRRCLGLNEKLLLAFVPLERRKTGQHFSLFSRWWLAESHTVALFVQHGSELEMYWVSSSTFLESFEV